MSEYDKQGYEVVYFLIELLNDSVPNQSIGLITGIFILKQMQTFLIEFREHEI